MTLARFIAAALATVGLSAAQEATFRVGTRLVEVSVTVLDRDGKPVTGLLPGNFAVEDAGEPRPVAFCQFDGETAAPRARDPLPKGVFTNMVEVGGGAPRNISALVLDGLNTPPEQNFRVRAQMMRYLKALAPETRIAVFHMGQRLRILHDFTDDTDSLREKIEKARLELPLESVTDVGETVIEAEQMIGLFGAGKTTMEAAERMVDAEMAANAAARRSRMERSLAAIEALGQHLAGIPGRKSMVWITSGISMLAILGDMGFGPRGDARNYEQQVRDTARRLAQRGIVLYIVDAAGLEAPYGMTAKSRAMTPQRGVGPFGRRLEAEAMNNDPFPAMSLLASVTGGRYLFNTNDLTVGFQKAVADLRGSYTIGFYAPEEGDGKWHKLRVRVARPGVHVRHREGYFADRGGAPQPDWNTASWRAAIASPLGSSAVRFVVTCRRQPEGDLHFQIRVAAASLQFREAEGKMTAKLQIMLAGRSAEGRIWRSLREADADLPPEVVPRLREAVVPLARTWKNPPPEVQTIRVIVRDREAGQYGTVDVPLKQLAPF